MTSYYGDSQTPVTRLVSSNPTVPLNQKQQRVKSVSTVLVVGKRIGAIKVLRSEINQTLTDTRKKSSVLAQTNQDEIVVRIDTSKMESYKNSKTGSKKKLIYDFIMREYSHEYVSRLVWPTNLGKYTLTDQDFQNVFIPVGFTWLTPSYTENPIPQEVTVVTKGFTTLNNNTLREACSFGSDLIIVPPVAGATKPVVCVRPLYKEDFAPYYRTTFEEIQDVITKDGIDEKTDLDDPYVKSKNTWMNIIKIITTMALECTELDAVEQYLDTKVATDRDAALDVLTKFAEDVFKNKFSRKDLKSNKLYDLFEDDLSLMLHAPVTLQEEIVTRVENVRTCVIGTTGQKGIANRGVNCEIRR